MAEGGRDYRRERLEQTFSLFETEEAPDFEIKPRVGDTNQGIEDIIKSIDALRAKNPGAISEDAANQAKIQAIAHSVNSKNKSFKTLEFVGKTDPYAELSPSAFAFTPTANTLAGMLAPADPNAADAKPDISTYVFKTDYDRSTTRKDYLEFIFKKVSARNINEIEGPGNDANAIRDAKALKTTQLDLIVTEIGTIQTPKARQEHDNALVRKAKSDMIGQNYLGATLQDNTVQCPKMGHANLLHADDLKNLNVYINNIPYGSERASKPLSAYLEFCAGIISDKYGREAAFSILLHCLSGEARKMTEWAKKLGEDFESHWVKLQCYFDPKQSTDQVNNRIRNICNERPIHLGETFGKVLNLIHLKYDDNEGDTLEVRKVLIQKECKMVYFRILKTWWPYKEPIIQQKFSNAIQHAKVAGVKQKPPSDMLLFISKEVIGSAPAVHRRNAQVYSIESGPEGMLSDEYLNSDINDRVSDDATSVSNAKPADVNAFQSNPRRPGPPNQPRRPEQNQRGNQGSSGSRNQTLRIPEHLKQKCLLCSQRDHAFAYCKLYPGAKPSNTQCYYCRALHPGNCASLGHKPPQDQVYEMSAENQSECSGFESPQYTDDTYVATVNTQNPNTNEQ